MDLAVNDSELYSPDGILTAIGQLDGQVRTLAKEIFHAPDRDPPVEVSADFETGWDVFTQTWASFKSEHTSWLSRTWNTTRTSLLAYAKTFNGFQQKWKAMIAEVGGEETQTEEAAPAPALKSDDGPLGALDKLGRDLGAALGHIALGAGVLVLVAGGAYVAWKMRGRVPS